MSIHAISQYALLADCRSAALVHLNGSIDWLCLPRFDSPAVFAKLLGEEAGHWQICPDGDYEAKRRYIDGSMVLETTFCTDQGTLVLRDALAMGPGETGDHIGEHSPHVLLREVCCTEGRVDVYFDYCPRPEYGFVAPLIHEHNGDEIIARGGASVLLLSTPVDVELTQSDARDVLTLEEGQTLRFSLQHASSSETIPTGWSDGEIEKRIDDTIETWQSWSRTHQNYEGPWKDLVDKSGRVLQALTYSPTGAIVAAPTTSLPEDIGGVRNWDYRYAWVRDASMTLDALRLAASAQEADRFFNFLTHATYSQLKRDGTLQIMFGIGGEHTLHEHELDHLSGWRDSSPVRVGNGAWRQRQWDVNGSLFDTLSKLRDQFDELAPWTCRFLKEVANTAAQNWDAKDYGIWEIRVERRHYLHSKLMCWVALDRAIDLSDLLGVEQRQLAEWKETRADIREAICERGWSEEIGAYIQAFDEHVLDAAVLAMPLFGFLPADDERMLSTMDAIERELTDARGLVHRYQADDGLPGEEGAFVLCTFWLAEARARAGQVDRARQLFERAIAHRNDVGLLAEEIEPETGALLGNFPQAFSHIGLINAANAICVAEEDE